MITYNELYEALRKERYSEQLQPLPKNFVKEMGAYLKDKRDIASQEIGEFSEGITKSKKQLENSIAIFRELMLRRKKKMLELAFVAAETGISKRDFENMLAPEKEAFEGIMKSLEKSDKKINDLLKNNSIEETNLGIKKLIVFNQDTDEFLDLDGNMIGPFKKGEIVNIAPEIANILVIDKKAEAIEEE